MKLSRRSIMAIPAVAFFMSKLPAFAQIQAVAAPLPGDTDWLAYGANNANTKYSALADIGPENFNKLEVAWRFKNDVLGPRPENNWESTPLVVKGRMFVTAGSRRDAVCL